MLPSWGAVVIRAFCEESWEARREFVRVGHEGGEVGFAISLAGFFCAEGVGGMEVLCQGIWGDGGSGVFEA